MHIRCTHVVCVAPLVLLQLQSAPLEPRPNPPPPPLKACSCTSFCVAELCRPFASAPTFTRRAPRSYALVMSAAASAPHPGTSALLLHCGVISVSNPRAKDQVHELLRYLSGHTKPKLVRRRTSIFKLEQELLLNLNPKPKVEEIALQEMVADSLISRRLVSFDKVASQGGMSRLGSHPASCGQLMRAYPLLADGCSRHTHSSPVPAALHAMGFKTSPPELVTVRECEEYTIPYQRLPCDIRASICTLYKLKPGAQPPLPLPPPPPSITQAVWTATSTSTANRHVRLLPRPRRCFCKAAPILSTFSVCPTCVELGARLLLRVTLAAQRTSPSTVTLTLLN